MTCRSPAWGAHGRLSVHKPDVPRAGVTVFHRGPKMSMHRRCFARHEGEGEKGTRTGDQPLCPVPGGPGSGSACSVKPFSSAGTSSSSAAPHTSGSLTRGWAVWVGERRGEGGPPECTPEPEDAAPVEGAAQSVEPPPAQLCSTKRPAFIPKNGNLARNTSECLYKASNCLTAIILGDLTRLHGCSLRIPLQLKNSTHGPLRVGPRGLPPSRGSAVPQGRVAGGEGSSGGASGKAVSPAQGGRRTLLPREWPPLHSEDAGPLLERIRWARTQWVGGG